MAAIQIFYHLKSFGRTKGGVDLALILRLGMIRIQLGNYLGFFENVAYSSVLTVQEIYFTHSEQNLSFSIQNSESNLESAVFQSSIQNKCIYIEKVNQGHCVDFSEKK